MTARSNRPDSPTPRPLSNWIIAAGALMVLAVAVVIWFVLLRRYGGEGASVQLDAIRTAGTLVIGTGGAVALLLTARRQRYTELTLVHTARDAIERRITELYTKAADQLGSEQAPVRLAGLYALERLAHSTVEHRQTIVDVICAYLRMPYTPPPQPSARVPGRSYRRPRPARQGRSLTDRPPHTPPTVQESRHEHAQQERQVRLTAQNILLRNLRVVPQRRLWWQRTPPPAVPTWPGIGLDLTEAVLLDFSLSKCQLDHADFTRAQFTGAADFWNAQFTGTADFRGAQFTDAADFRGAQFTDTADFRRAQFTDTADFRNAQFTDAAHFWNAQFTGWADFWNAQFNRTADFSVTQFNRTADFSVTQFIGMADFRGAQFTDAANFRNAQFTGGADSSGAQLTGGADFAGTQFTDRADFTGTRVTSAAEPESAWPPGWITRSAQPDNGEDPAFLYLERIEELPDA